MGRHAYKHAFFPSYSYRCNSERIIWDSNHKKVNMSNNNSHFQRLNMLHRRIQPELILKKSVWEKEKRRSSSSLNPVFHITHPLIQACVRQHICFIHHVVFVSFVLCLPLLFFCSSFRLMSHAVSWEFARRRHMHNRRREQEKTNRGFVTKTVKIRLRIVEKIWLFILANILHIYCAAYWQNICIPNPFVMLVNVCNANKTT